MDFNLTAALVTVGQLFMGAILGGYMTKLADMIIAGG